MEPASRLVDCIIYTASLATNTVEIDPQLEIVRGFTASKDLSQPANAEDQSRLLAVQQQLETYLLTKENIRSFTADSLRLQIEQHMNGHTDTKSLTRLRIVLAVAFGTALAVATLLPLESIQQRIQAGGATAFSLVTVGAGWLFFTALSAFKSELRKAFIVIVTGVTLLGLSLLEQPVMEIFNLRQYPIVSILYPLPILIAAICFHVGDNLYVRLLGIRNFWTSIWPIVIGFVPLAIMTWLVPHAKTTETELVHDAAAIIWLTITLMPIASAIILPMAVRKLPELYKNSARFLFLAMFPIIAVCVYQYTVRIVAGPLMAGPVAYALFSLVTFMGLGLLVAGYTFNKVSRY